MMEPGAGIGAGPEWAAPHVSPVSLYSYLVTRQTGRAVRVGIEERLAEYDRQVLAVVDFREVQVIDFSCADEIVAKLVLHSFGRPGSRPTAFFLFRGMEPHHVDPVDSALKRQGLAVAAERGDGRAVLLGSLSRRSAHAWRVVWGLGRAAPATVAARLGAAEGEAGTLLAALFERRLLLRDGREYVSFRHALRASRPYGEDRGANG